MAQLRFEISMSLDGFLAGPDPGPDQPLGKGGEQLHEWAFGLESWREPHGREGGQTGPESDMLAASRASTGASIMGRGMFGGEPGPWGEDPWTGWWGDDPPFKMPVFVLTHHEREPLVLEDTTFTFVTDGILSALEQARAAAGEEDVVLAGGASVAQQYLSAGLLDEIRIDLVPVLLGGGVPLFDNVGDGIELEQVAVLESRTATHLTYRIVR